jgi:hypothetical protein
VALALLTCVSQGPSFIASLRPPRTVGIDFFQDWASARNYRDGLPVYTDHKTAVDRYLGYRIDPVRFEVNAHPPTSVLLALPLAALDYPDAALVWNLVSLGALGVSLWLIGRTLGVPLTPWSIFPAVTLLLICTPFRQQVNQGQFNLLLLLLLTGVWTADRSGRLVTAGSLLGLATAIKLFPAVLFLYFAVRGRWRAVAAGIISLAVVTLLTAALLGTDTYRSYIHDVLPQVRQYRSCWNNASLPGLWVKLFDPASEDHIEPLWRSPLAAEGGALLSCLAVVVVLVRALWKARKEPHDDRGFALTVIAMLLVSAITWEQYFLLLLLPVAVFWVRLPASILPRWSFVAILLVLFCIHPVLLYDTFIPGGYPQGPVAPVQTLAVLSLQCYALVGLFVFGLVMGRDREVKPDGV